MDKKVVHSRSVRRISLCLPDQHNTMVSSVMSFGSLAGSGHLHIWQLLLLGYWARQLKAHVEHFSLQLFLSWMNEGSVTSNKGIGNTEGKLRVQSRIASCKPMHSHNSFQSQGSEVRQNSDIKN